MLTSVASGRQLLSLTLGVAWFITGGCMWFGSQSEVELGINDRPWIAILPFGIDIEIKKLSSITSVDASLSAEDEARRIGEATQEIREEARWLFQSRLITRHAFRFVSHKRVDAAVAELELKARSLADA